jgi:hypothetical protein
METVVSPAETRRSALKPLLIMASAIALGAAAPSFAQSAYTQSIPGTASSTLITPAVPGTVRADSLVPNGAPAESAPFGAPDRSSMAPPVATDNAPIRESDLTAGTTRHPIPTLAPSVPLATGKIPPLGRPQPQ